MLVVMDFLKNPPFQVYKSVFYYINVFIIFVGIVDCYDSLLSVLYEHRLSKLKVLKGVYGSSWKPISKLQSVTCHMGSDSVTWHPTQANVPHLNPSQASRYSIYLPCRDGRLSRPRWLVMYWDVSPVAETSNWPKSYLSRSKSNTQKSYSSKSKKKYPIFSVLEK